MNKLKGKDVYKLLKMPGNTPKMGKDGKFKATKKSSDKGK
jgi:hypothetical protein